MYCPNYRGNIKKISISKLKSHIKKCNKYDKRFNFLGFLENKELSPEVECMFTFVSQTGCVVYDWVNGNTKLEGLIEECCKV